MKTLDRLRAFLGGTFALPCPICTREFYGFQWKQCGHVPSRDPERRAAGIEEMICPRCTRIHKLASMAAEKGERK